MVTGSTIIRRPNAGQLGDAAGVDTRWGGLVEVRSRAEGMAIEVAVDGHWRRGQTIAIVVEVDVHRSRGTLFPEADQLPVQRPYPHQ